MKTTLGNYDLYIYVTDSDESFTAEAEPFSYTAIVKTKDDLRWFVTMCNDIPCDSCPLATDCKNGTNRNDTLDKYLNENHPELLI